MYILEEQFTVDLISTFNPTTVQLCTLKLYRYPCFYSHGMYISNKPVFFWWARSTLSNFKLYIHSSKSSPWMYISKWKITHYTSNSRTVLHNTNVHVTLYPQPVTVHLTWTGMYIVQLQTVHSLQQVQSMDVRLFKRSQADFILTSYSIPTVQFCPLQVYMSPYVYSEHLYISNELAHSMS